MRIEQLEGLNNRFNGGVWQTEEGTTRLLLRHVEKPGEDGEPDRGDLVMVELRGQEKIWERVVWSSQPNLNLEDPRVIRSGKGSLLVGLTAVVTEDGKHTPYPAFVKMDEDLEGYLPPVYIAKSLGPGKNTTPINGTEFFFRPEDQTHKLRVVSWDNQNAPIVESEIVFDPIPPWAEYKIGTTFPPIWQNQERGLMFLHGISVKDGIYDYALTPALLNRHNGGYRVTMADKPIITSNQLQENGHDSQELHPNRRAVYLCGAVQNGEQLELYVDSGDTKTVRVTNSLQELTNMIP